MTYHIAPAVEIHGQFCENAAVTSTGRHLVMCTHSNWMFSLPGYFQVWSCLPER